MKTYTINCDQLGIEDYLYKHSDASDICNVAEDFIAMKFWEMTGDTQTFFNNTLIVEVDGVKVEVTVEPDISVTSYREGI